MAEAKLVEGLVAQQKATGEAIQSFVKNYKKCAKDRITVGYLKGRLDGLRVLWEKFSNTHAQICTTVTDRDLPYFVKETYEFFEDLCYEWVGQITDILDEKMPSAPSTSQPPLPVVPQTCNHRTSITLPPINLPNFSGDYSDWRYFRDMFQSLVGNNDSLTSVQRLHYLKSSVSGEPAQLLRSYNMADDSFEDAWKALNQRYENKRLLVNSQLAMLFLEKTVTKETATSLKSLYDNTNESIAALKALDVPVEKWDLAIVFNQTRHLPQETKRLWEQHICINTEPPTLWQYLSFLEGRFRVLEALPDDAPSKSSRTHNIQSHTATKTSTCCLCNQDHHVRRCPLFVQNPVHTRVQIVKDKSLCFNCLASEHTAQNCPSQRGCFHCSRRHHTLLHVAQPSTRPEIQVTTLHTQKGHEQVLLSTALLRVHVHGRSYQLRALIDTGSQASFITTTAFQRLRAKPTSTIATISGLGGTRTGTSYKSVEFNISSRFDDVILTRVKAIVLPSLTKQLPSTQIKLPICPHLANIQLADPNYNEPGAIDILLGSDVYPVLVREGVRTGPEYTPVAQSTALGWVLLGPVKSNAQNQKLIYSFHNKLDFESQLMKFWEIEEVNTCPTSSEDDIQCEKHFEETHQRDSQGRYVVALPFKRSPSTLGESFPRAMSQLLSQERRLKRNSTLNEEYTQCLEEYISLGQMELIPDNEISCLPCYYLPHHAVVKASSTTTKVRVVFNASCITNRDVSLNDLLYTGPGLHQDLVAVLIRFRFHRIAVTADMKQMFRQIRVKDADCDFQRVLWRKDPTQSVKHYRLKTVTFGVSSAPFLAMRSIQQLVTDEGGSYPLASRMLTYELYVDNILSGGDNQQEVQTGRTELIHLLEKAGIELRQWASNDCEILASIPVLDRLPSSTLDISEKTSAVNMLGISWDTKEDTLFLKVSNNDISTAVSKRLILSDIAKLFDPLGLYALVIVIAKIILQRLWLLKVGWDEILPRKEQNKWIKFKTSLHHLQQISIPRWFQTNHESTLQLHGFCDASERAYAAVVYLRVDNNSQTVSTSLIMAKTKVAPIKTVTLPRLELCGAALLAKLMEKVISILGTRTPLIEIYCWTDSTITLAWLSKHPCHWKTFIANRVTNIYTNIPTAKWHHVSSWENPADIASRGVDPERLASSKLWWNGPNWLIEEPRVWPKTTTYETDEEERKIIALAVRTDSDYVLDITKYSSYIKLLRVTAYIQRFVSNCKSNLTKRVNRYLTEFELKQSADYWIRNIQSEFFSTEIELLKRRREQQQQEPTNSFEKPNKYPFKALTPFVDGIGILRVGGRLKHADIPNNEKHPILLPYACHLSKLIVRDAHLNTLHGGTTATIAYIRRKFWILKIKPLVKYHIHRCIRCFRQLRTTSEQLMGDLPKPRITPARPFLATGIDYAGPISLRASNLRNAKVLKGYFAIFVCLCTKAIHLEAVSDLTTDSFLAALRRFMARRGLCKEIYSDCGTNFVGADASLRKSYQRAIKTANKDVAEIIANDGVNWHFIPASRRSVGGRSSIRETPSTPSSG